VTPAGLELGMNNELSRLSVSWLHAVRPVKLESTFKRTFNNMQVSG
jgi:hypothetical protein